MRLPRTLRRDPGPWRYGLLTGLATSTFSSVMVGIGARFIGRSARVDWMELGTIVLRGRAAGERPRVPAMAAGLAVHQSADIFWAAVWGRIAASLPARARQPATAAAWLPWSAATAQRDLRVLGRLMAAEHAAELALMRSWWRGWYGGDLPAPTPEDHARMQGMPADADMELLRRQEGVAFDRLFCDLMITHHEGGIAMARELRRTGGDPRLKLMCVAIDHAQVGQVVRMRALRP